MRVIHLKDPALAVKVFLGFELIGITLLQLLVIGSLYPGIALASPNPQLPVMIVGLLASLLGFWATRRFAHSLIRECALRDRIRSICQGFTRVLLSYLLIDVVAMVGIAVGNTTTMELTSIIWLIILGFVQVVWSNDTLHRKCEDYRHEDISRGQSLAKIPG